MNSPHSSPAQSVAARDPILVVDDEAPMLEVITQVLGASFDLTTAKSAREAEFALRKIF